MGTLERLTNDLKMVRILHINKIHHAFHIVSIISFKFPNRVRFIMRQIQYYIFYHHTFLESDRNKQSKIILRIKIIPCSRSLDDILLPRSLKITAVKYFFLFQLIKSCFSLSIVKENQNQAVVRQ